MRCFQSLGLDEALAKTMDPTAALRGVTLAQLLHPLPLADRRRIDVSIVS